MNIKGGALLMTAIMLAACSQSKKGANTESNGTIVQLDKKDGDLTTLKTKLPNNRVSVLSLENNLFQIEGIKIEDAQTLLPHSYVEDDTVTNYLNPELNKNSSDRARDLTKRSDVMEKYTNLGCHRNDLTPTADISLKSDTEFVTSTVVKQNSAPITLSAEASAPTPAASGANTTWDPTADALNDPLANSFWSANRSSTLGFHWVLDVPPGTSTAKSADGTEVVITPDQYGGYTAILIVQDKVTLACDVTAVVIGVTANEKYAGKQNAPVHAVDTDVFHHLSVVQAPTAWAKTKGEGVVVAVIDTGINYNHPELADNIFVNKKEIPNNNLDDDKNGLVDDVNGYDFSLNDNIPFDDESHGTHVSGLVGGKNVGIAPGATILPIKALLATGSASNASILAGIYYAIKMKADIINMSLGGEGPTSPMMTLALKKAQQAGILVVVAAGNSSEDVDVVPSHFTNKDGTNVLAIAATDENGALTDYSCFGVKTVDMAAPGGTDELPVSSTSTWVNEMEFVGFSGTSMASPVAAGVAALGKSLKKSLTPEQLKALILSTGVESAGLVGKVNVAKVVNAANLVESLSPSVIAGN